jgi:transposase
MTVTTTVTDKRVFGGVDTHKDFHVAAVLNAIGGLLGVKTFPSTLDGYEQLLCWMQSFGEINRVGVEGTGSWGAGLNRFFFDNGIVVVEVNRPNRQMRRRKGKSDAADAQAAARAVLSGEATATPKSNDGAVAAMRVIKIALNSALQSRTQAANQIRSIIDTGPNDLREELRDLSMTKICQRTGAYRPGANIYEVRTATKYALRKLARRWLALTEEINELKRDLRQLVEDHAPKQLLDAFGVGVDTATTLMITAGDNPGRVTSDAKFAALCGVSPRDASSGRNQRHRLNRTGNRDANRALRTVVLVRLRYDQEPKDYMAKRIAEGKTKREVIRCLKRSVARQLWRALQPPKAPMSAA